MLPLSGSSIEDAIRLNGVAVCANRQAFRYGRLWAHDRERILGMLTPPALDATGEYRLRRNALRGRRRAGYDRLWHQAASFDAETRRLLAVRLGELVDYQSERYAREYLDTVTAIGRREQEVAPGSHDLTRAVARNLYKLMAYKDEYEVARLFLKPGFAARIAETFDQPVRVVNHLSPPAARALGRTRKLAIGPWFRPGLRLLRLARRLRGTPLDIFRRQPSRVEERELVTWYRQLIDDIHSELRNGNHAVAVTLADLPDRIRGYEQVKRQSAEAARAEEAVLREQLRRPMLPISVA
jgi:indolepyruvate ferredoxin oxidoreductase